MANSEIIKLERLRAKLVSILQGKGKTIADDAGYATAVPMVNELQVLDDNFVNLLQGNSYEINDTEGKVKKIAANTFRTCVTRITKVYLPECTELEESALCNSSAATEAYLPKCKVFGKYSLGGLNPGVTSLSKVTLCDDITSIDKDFLDSSIVEELRLGTVGTITGDFCCRCSKLRIVTFETLNSIGFGADGSRYTFAACPLLKIADFGNLSAITDGDVNTWKNDVNLKAIVIRSAAVPTLGSADAFLWLKNNVTGWKIYVNDSLVETYKTADNWSNYADYFAPLSEYDEETILNSADADTSSAKAAIFSEEEEEAPGGEE